MMIRPHFREWSAETDALLTDRQRLVFDTVNIVMHNYVGSLPVDIERLCRIYGVELVTLTEYERGGISEEEMNYIWGNPDGAASFYGDHPLIGYNDRAPEKRKRFTLAEELMHILLGHVYDPRFNIFDQAYSPAVYARYEHEAKTAAGLLLFPAPLYYAHKREYSLHALALVCNISDACAFTCAQYYNEKDDLLRQVYTGKYLAYKLPVHLAIEPCQPLSVWKD